MTPILMFAHRVSELCEKNNFKISSTSYAADSAQVQPSLHSLQFTNWDQINCWELFKIKQSEQDWLKS